MENKEKTKNERDSDSKETTIQAYKDSIGYLRWALALAIAICAYLVFQSKREYKDALEDIRYYRNEAQSATQKINDEGGRVIKAVQEKGNNAIIQIEKKSQEEIEKLKKQVLEQKDIFNLWIKVITDQDENAVLAYLEILEEKEPDNWLVYDYKGSVYYEISQKIEMSDEKHNEKEKELLLKSKDCFIKSYSLHKGICIIDIIKICAKLDDEDGCKKWIKTGLNDNVISYKEIFKDSNVYRYNSKDWFKEYSAKLQSQNQK